MYVIKRDGRQEPVHFDKITLRIQTLANVEPKLDRVDCSKVSQATIAGVYAGVTTEALDRLSADVAAELAMDHPQYSVLAGRILASNLQKTAPPTFLVCVAALVVSGVKFNDDFIADTLGAPPDVQTAWNTMVVPARDMTYDYFAMRTLMRTYLLRASVNNATTTTTSSAEGSTQGTGTAAASSSNSGGQVMETPQYCLLRYAIQLHRQDIKAVQETYEAVSRHWFTPATPTLAQSGLALHALSSCYLLTIAEDSLESIYDAAKEAAIISKSAGGIGLAVHNIRAAGTHIAGTNGVSNGLLPMLRLFNQTARYVDQGGNKRPGAMAVYVAPHHPDIFSVLDMRLPTGDMERRCLDLHLGLWISDLFMRRVEANAPWTLLCPHVFPGLDATYGVAFDQLYEQHEARVLTSLGLPLQDNEEDNSNTSNSNSNSNHHQHRMEAAVGCSGHGFRVVRARDVYSKIVSVQIQASEPYMLFKDTINAQSNQQNHGLIQSSNLCTEIVEVSGPEETAVCNLASLSLPDLMTRQTADGTWDMDWDLLDRTVALATRNLNVVIARTRYPDEKTKRSNLRLRPIALGVQGLADVFMRMGIAYTSGPARALNRRLFAHIYFHALRTSCELARAHPDMVGVLRDTPLVRDGRFHFDLMEARLAAVTGGAAVAAPPGEESPPPPPLKLLDGLDWETLRRDIMTHGVVNSLLVAPMPTASTSQILGNTESFEPLTSNFYYRRTLAGNFPLVNKWLIAAMEREGLLRTAAERAEFMNALMRTEGSVQPIAMVPAHLKPVFATVWEINPRSRIEMAADMARYVDQSMSFNAYFVDVTPAKLWQYHMATWKAGLKTGMYYLRTKAVTNGMKWSSLLTPVSTTSSLSPLAVAATAQAPAVATAQAIADVPLASLPTNAPTGAAATFTGVSTDGQTLSKSVGPSGACPWRPRTGDNRGVDDDAACAACSG